MKDCWNQIGVWSRHAVSCGKLLTVVHCRNCEVYTSAGRRALERRAPEEYDDVWLQNNSQVNHDNRKKTTSVVVFRLGVDWFGLPTVYFKSIENLGFIHSIPRYTNDYLLGVVNVRGTVQLCFSMKSLLQVSGEKDNPAGKNSVGVYRRLMVLVNNNQFYVFPVDEVGGLERIDDSTLEILPSTTNERRAQLVKGLVSTPEQRIALLNSPHIFEALEAAIGG